MHIRGLLRGVALAVVVTAAALWVAPGALARTHVSIGIAVPGVTVSAGNCWRCGYWAPPPVYYQPTYPAPVYYPPAYYGPQAYYPAPVYYAPRRVYYGGYGYYAPRYRAHGYYRGDHHRDRGWRHGRGGYYHRDHR